MYAVILTGGKQYKVALGDVIEVEKLAAEPGDKVTLPVLFISTDDGIVVDADELAKASVEATVVEHFKGEKQLVFKFKKRKGYKKMQGHRQQLTRIQATAITTPDGKTSTFEAPAPKQAAADEPAPAADDEKQDDAE